MTKTVNFKDNNWLKRWPLNKKDRGSGFTLIEIIIVIAIIGILVTIVIAAINPEERLNNANDTKRKTDIHNIVVGLETYRLQKGYYPADIEATDDSEGCDSSKGSSTDPLSNGCQVCTARPPDCTGDWDHNGGIYKALIVDTGIMLSLPKDPQNYNTGGWSYKYEPAKQVEPIGSTVCAATAPGPCYYYIAARLKSGPRKDLYTAGYPECSGPPCTYVFVCHNYPDDKYFKQFYTTDMSRTIDGLPVKSGCNVRVSKDST